MANDSPPDSPDGIVDGRPRSTWLVPILAGLIGALGGALIGGLSSVWVANLQFNNDSTKSARETRLAAYDEFLFTLGQIDLEMDSRISAWESNDKVLLEQIQARAEKNEEAFRRAGTRALLVSSEAVLPHINRLIYRQIAMFSETNPEIAGGISNARAALLKYRQDYARMMASFMREARGELQLS